MNAAIPIAAVLTVSMTLWKVLDTGRVSNVFDSMFMTGLYQST